MGAGRLVLGAAWAHRPTELRADDAGGDGGVEGFGAAEAGDGDAAREPRGDCGRGAAAFAADDDDGVAERGERMHAVAHEIAAEHGRSGGGERGGEIGGVRGHAGKGAHAGIDDFLMKEIGAVGREHDAVEGEPVGDAEGSV